MGRTNGTFERYYLRRVRRRSVPTKSKVCLPTKFHQITLFLAPLYSLTMFFVKMSIYLLYHRLFAIDRWKKIAIYSGMGISSCFYLAMFTAELVLCVPRQQESWTSKTYRKRCTREEALSDVHGVFDLVSDLYIFILPLPVLCRLQMSLNKKIGVTATFLTGLM